MPYNGRALRESVSSAVRSRASWEVRWMERPTPFWEPFFTTDKDAVLAATHAFRSAGLEPRPSVLASTFDGAITTNLARIPTIVIGPAGRGIHCGASLSMSKA